MRGIFVVAIYFIFAVVFYGIIKTSYNRAENRNSPNKISVFSISFLSVLAVFLNIICTNLSVIVGSDRINYIYEFSGARSPDSIGLQLVFFLVHLIGGDINYVYIITTFVSVFVTLLAYRKSKYAQPQVIALLLSTQWIFYTFTALKQSFANAFVAVAFVCFIESEKRKDYLLGVMMLVIAIVFHSSAIALLPVLILLFLQKKSSRRNTFYSALIIIGSIFIRQISLIIARFISPILPLVSLKIIQYMSKLDTSSINSMTIFKYVSIFIILIWAYANRKQYRLKIDVFSKYFLTTLYASILLIYSVFSYWFVRFIDLFYFPIFVFYALIDRDEYLYSNKIIIRICVYGLQIIFLIRWIMRIFNIYGGL